MSNFFVNYKLSKWPCHLVLLVLHHYVWCLLGPHQVGCGLHRGWVEQSELERSQAWDSHFCS
jgi:hypothetical protein